MGAWQYRKCCTQVHTRRSSSSIPVCTKMIQIPLDTEHTLLKMHQVPTGALSSGRTPSTRSPARVCGKAERPILMLFRSSFVPPHYNPSSDLCLRGMIFLSLRPKPPSTTPHYLEALLGTDDSTASEELILYHHQLPTS